MDVREKLVEILKQAPFEGKVLDEWWWEEKIARIADHLIAHGVTVQEWISVKDGLPDDNERVIAYRPNEPETSAYKYCVMWGWSVKTSLKHRGITHWRVIPQPPKGE